MPLRLPLCPPLSLVGAGRSMARAAVSTVRRKEGGAEPGLVWVRRGGGERRGHGGPQVLPVDLGAVPLPQPGAEGASGEPGAGLGCLHGARSRSFPPRRGALRGEGRGRLSGIGGARGGRLRLQPGGAGRAGGTSEPAESRVAPSPPAVGTPDPATAGVEAGTRARPAVPAPRSEHPAARAFCSLGLAELRGRSVPRSGTPLAAVPKVGRADPSERNRLRYLLVSGSRLLVVGSPRCYRRGFS